MTLEELEIVVKANVKQATKQLEDLKAQMKEVEKDDGVQENLGKISTASRDTGEILKKTSKDFSIMESAGSGALEALLKKFKMTKAECGEVSMALSEMGTSLGSVLSILGVVAIAVVAVIVRIKILIEEYKLIWKMLIAFLTPAVKIFVGILKQVAKVIKDQVSQAITTLKQKMSDGINNLVQVNSQLNKSMSELKSSLIQTGNALATAVAPVIQAIIPLMTRLLEIITNVANGIAQVTASLFGNATTFKKAIKVNEDYANSVSKINGQLAKFDELNVLSDNGSANPWEMFKDEDIDPDILELTTKLKDLWNTDDIEGLETFGKELGQKVKKKIEELPAEEWGKELGKNVNKALTLANGFLEEQPFESLGGKIADLLLGFIDDEEGLSPETVGRFIGNLINNGIGMIGSFLDEMDAKDGWKKVGSWLARALNEYAKTIDAEELGQAINQFVKGCLDLAIEFVNKADWDTYTDDICTALEQMDWVEIAEKILTLLGIGWSKSEQMRKRIIWTIVSDIYNELHESANPFVYLILGRVFFIVDSIKTTFNSLKETLKDIIKDLKQEFEGFIEFFTGVFTGDWQKAWGGIKKIAVSIANRMADEIVGIVNILIGLINTGIDRIEDMVNAMVDTVNAVSPQFNLKHVNLSKYHVATLETRTQKVNKAVNQAMSNWQTNNVGPVKKFASGGVVDRPTMALMGEYPGANSNPEIVAPQNILLETSERANIPVMNSIEEMGDKLVTALNSIGVYAEFDYSKLKVGLDNENYRVGGKLYGI